MNQKQKKTWRLLIFLLMAVIGAASFRFGYLNFTDKTKELEEEIEKMELELFQLRILANQTNDYEKILGENKAKQKSILNTYGPGTSPSKSTMFLVDAETAYHMTISNISFGNPEILYTSNTLLNPSGLPYTIAKTGLNFSYVMSYQNLKNLLAHIITYDERMIIDNISASFDQQSGLLNGNINLNWYSLFGGDKFYEDPTIVGIPLGTDNFFHSTN